MTLKCSIDEDSNKWGYEWFINGAQPPKDKDFSFPGNTLSISSAKAGHSGQYTCRGRHLTRTAVTTGQTEAVQLHIQGKTTYAILRLININKSDRHPKEFNEEAAEYFELLLKIWYTTWFIWKKRVTGTLKCSSVKKLYWPVSVYRHSCQHLQFPGYSSWQWSDTISSMSLFIKGWFILLHRTYAVDCVIQRSLRRSLTCTSPKMSQCVNSTQTESAVIGLLEPLPPYVFEFCVFFPLE